MLARRSWGWTLFRWLKKPRLAYPGLYGRLRMLLAMESRSQSWSLALILEGTKRGLGLWVRGEWPGAGCGGGGGLIVGDGPLDG